MIYRIKNYIFRIMLGGGWVTFGRPLFLNMGFFHFLDKKENPQSIILKNSIQETEI